MVAQRPFFIGRPGWVRSSAWICDFSSNAEHHRMGGRVDIEPDHLLELVGEFGVVGELEGAHPMRLQTLPGPDPAHRGRADPDRPGHRRRGPVGRLMRRRLIGQFNHPVDRFGRQRCDARGPGLVAGQPRHPLRHKALLPAPDHGLALSDRAHDRHGAEPVAAQQHDPRPPHVFLRAVAIPDDRLQAPPIRRRNLDADPLAHAASSHRRPHRTTGFRTLPSGAIH